MDTTQILPNIGSPVSSPAFDPAAADDMSVGEAAYAAAFFTSVFAERMANPAAAGDFARFVTASGEDWSGFRSATAPGAVPIPPENYYDSLPGIAHMVRHQQRATDAILTHFAAHLEPALGDQAALLGTPDGVTAYKSGHVYFREVLKLSTAQTTKIHDRVPYATWASGKNPALATYQPNLLKFAESFAEGKISGENLDRIISMDKDLTKYVHKTKALPEVKQEILLAFEDALVDAAESLTPDELSEAKSRWANKIAHAMDPDGPLVAEAIRKQPDNAIRTQNLADGSGRISMHATPAVYAAFKNWSLHQLNFNGTPVEVPQEVLDLLAAEDDDDQEAPDPATAYNDLNDLQSTPAPDAQAEDPDGTTLSAEETAAIDPLTTGQRLAAIVIGMFQNLLTMDPKDLGAKKAHGASAQLMIVQDIQTAYETLGVGALPEAVRRPPKPPECYPR